MARPDPSASVSVNASFGVPDAGAVICTTAHREVGLATSAPSSGPHPARGVDPAMYAIVTTGGKQYKVAEGDVIDVEKLDAEPGAEVALSAILLVDGDTVTHEADKLANATITAEVVAQGKGPKIRIHKFKSKTGYHKRQGHRQRLTQLKVTGISAQ